MSVKTTFGVYYINILRDPKVVINPLLAFAYSASIKTLTTMGLSTPRKGWNLNRLFLRRACDQIDPFFKTAWQDYYYLLFNYISCPHIFLIING